MRRHLTVPLSLLLTAGCAAALTVASPGAARTPPADHPARALPVVKVINIKTLPPGAKLTTIAYLDRDWTSSARPTLHRPGKATVKLPLSWRDGAVALLGKGTHGFVVRNGTGPMSLFNVTDSGAHRFYLDSLSRYWQEARLTTDGAAVVVSGVPSGEPSMVARRVPVAGSPGPETVIGADANGPYLVGAIDGGAVFPQWFAATRVWRFGVGMSNLTPNRAVLVDQAHHRLFVNTSGSGSPLSVGPTKLATPGAPAWKANFSPQTVSPDGKLVAGWAGQANTTVQVRRLSDGVVVARFTSATETLEGDKLVEPLVWESGQTLLLQTWTGNDKWAITRCTMAGKCSRATAIRDGRISFPTRDRPSEWWLY